jgi:alkylated DNA nucleotide flippase Atl1
MNMALIVGRLKTQLGSVKVIGVKKKASQVVKVRDSLTGRIKCKWWRVLCNVGKELIREFCFTTLLLPY